MTFKDQQLNSMTFQAWKTKFLNSMTFQVFHDLYESCERDLELCLQKTAKINKIFVPRDQVFLLLSFIIHYNYMEISGFTLVLSIRNVLSCFHLLIFYFEKFLHWISCLPFAVNVTGNLFIMKTTNQNKEFSSPLKMWKIENKKHKNKLKKLPVKMLRLMHCQ